MRNRKKTILKNQNIIPFLIIGIDSSWRIIQWNSQAEELPGIELGQVIGRRLDDVIPEFESIFNYIDKAFTEHSPQQINSLSICLDGEYKYYNITIFPVELAKGNYMVISITDVTENERKNVQLMQFQKIEMVGTLAGGLVHDINNILCGIIGTVYNMKLELAEGPIPDRGNLINYLDIIDKSGKRAVKTVEQFMSISRKKKLSMGRIDLNESVRNVLLLCRNTFDKSVSITVEYLEQPAYVNGDASQIEQKFLNLCINASHAMTIMRDNADVWGGRLFVSVKNQIPDQKFINSHPEAENRNYKVVSFKDSGVGMEQEILDKIFIPFFSTKKDGSGTGLGLAMVCSITRQHNGFIDVLSEPGKGSEFKLYIPAFKL